MAWDAELDKNSAAYRFAADNSKVIRVVGGPGTGKSFGLQRRCNTRLVRATYAER